MPIPTSLIIFITCITSLLGLGGLAFRARLLSWSDFRAMVICTASIFILLPSIPYAVKMDDDGEVTAQEAQEVAEKTVATIAAEDPKPKTWYQLAKSGKFPRITILDGDTSTEFQIQTITSTTTSIVPIGQYFPDTSQMDNNPPLNDPVAVPSPRRKR